MTTPPTPPDDAPARPSVASLTVSNLMAISPKAAERLKDVPADRLREKSAAGLLGAAFGVIGAILLGLAVRLLYVVVLAPIFASRYNHASPPEPGTSTWVGIGLLGAAGISLLVIGAAIADFEVVKNPFMFFVAFLRGVVDAVRGRGAPQS